MTIATIGHSTRPLGEFIAMLHAHGIRQLIDVRTLPRSRHNPQFNGDVLAAALPSQQIVYRHLKALGGLRRARKDSPNTGWRNASFRGYADYMQTPDFTAALEALIALAGTKPTAILCAEAVPWRCHRSLVADALAVRGIPVEHLTSRTAKHPHRLTPFAVVTDGRLAYPAAATEATPSLPGFPDELQ